jgi:hypothetical protein
MVVTNPSTFAKRRGSNKPQAGFGRIEATAGFNHRVQRAQDFIVTAIDKAKFSECPCCGYTVCEKVRFA